MTNKTRSRSPQMPTAAAANGPASPVGAATKVGTLIALLTRTEGATLDHLVTVTGWQAHTTRAALTRLKARGYSVTSIKAGGVRTYRASGPVVS